MKKLRFFFGRFWLNVGLYIMPSEAKAYFGYNIHFLWQQSRGPDRRCAHGKLFTESCEGCGYVRPEPNQQLRTPT